MQKGYDRLKGAPTFAESYTLDPAAIDRISEGIGEYCVACKMESKDAIRYRLTAEECMLRWIDAGMQGAKVTIDTKSRVLSHQISLNVEGKRCNPLLDESIENDLDYQSRHLLSSLGLSPNYSYSHGENHLQFSIKRNASPIATLIVIIIASALVGFLGQLLVPADALSSFRESIIEPLYNTFFNVLGCIAGPMVFLSVAWGICGIGDARTLGRVGKRMLGVFLGATFCAAIIGLLSFPVLGPGLSGGSSGSSEYSSIFALILGIIPPNVFQPFIDGNTLQIIFLAFVLGIALVFLERKASYVTKAIEQVNGLVNFLMELVGRLVPFFVFLVILNMIWSDSLSVLAISWKLLLAIVIGFFALCAIFFTIGAIRFKANPFSVLRKGLPAFLIALTTASSAAAFGTTVKICENGYGVRKSMAGFGVPLGMVMHNPFASMYNVMLVVFFAGFYNINCSPSWLVMLAFIAFVVAIATPPVPGGAAAAYTMLFSQMGIPLEALALVLAIDVLTDFIITACEMLCLPISVANIAANLGMIDKKALEEIRRK